MVGQLEQRLKAVNASDKWFRGIRGGEVQGDGPSEVDGASGEGP